MFYELRGQVLTAGVIQDHSVLLQMIQRDDAYNFLKNVRGSPAYFQRVQYEVLAMIRQLGIPHSSSPSLLLICSDPDYC